MKDVEISPAMPFTTGPVALFLRGSCRSAWPSISARAENRCDDGGRIHRSLSRISLFCCLRDRPESVGDRTLYRQQTPGSSCVPWLYPSEYGEGPSPQFQQWNDCSKLKSED